MDLLKDLPNSIYGYNLAFLSSRLRDDEDIVEAFLSNVCDDNSATPFISDRLKSDKKFIFRMVSSGYNMDITHISAELRRDREFILSISEFIGLYQIPKKLRKDKGILLKSSKCDIIYVKYLPEELRKDYAFIYKSFKCYNENNRKHFRTIEVKNKRLISAINDFKKLGGYETIVRTVMKLNLPIEIGRIVYDYV